MMATVTREVGGFEGGLIVWQYDYDDQTLYVLTIRCLNQTDSTAWASATDTIRDRTYERTWPAQATTEQAIPTGQANRLELVVGPRGVENFMFRMTW